MMSLVTVCLTATIAFPFLWESIDTTYVIKACNLLRVYRFLAASHEKHVIRDSVAF